MKFYFQIKNLAALFVVAFNCSCIAAQNTTFVNDTTSKTIARHPSDSIVAFSLLSFTGSNNDGQNTFTWKTDSRSAFTKFVIEVSADRNHFTTVSDIRQSNDSRLNSFVYIESKPAFGRSYYRLKMIDSSGAVTYSTIIAVNNISVSNLQIQYESGSGTVAISGATTGINYQLKLYNSGGQMQLQKIVNADQPTINISQLAHGLYVVYVTDGVAAPVSRKIIW